MNRYLPGQAIRLSTTITILGVLTNPSTIVLTIQPPVGAAIVLANPINDSVGAYHMDFLVPGPVPGPSATPGIWLYRWVTTGAPPQQNGIVEGKFLVNNRSFLP